MSKQVKSLKVGKDHTGVFVLALPPGGTVDVKQNIVDNRVLDSSLAFVRVC